MSETTIEHTEHGDTGSLTPLDAILGSGGEPGDVTATGEPSSQEPELSNDAGEMVPLVALKRERERRQKMDKQVQELEAELQRYNDQKWGFEEEPSQQQAAAGPDPGTDRVIAEYNNSYARFVQKHGQARVAEIDAALRRLNPEQQAHVTSLVGQGAGDPVERVQAYIEQQGLLFKPTDLRDALSGKTEQPREASQADAGLTQREQAIIAAERRTEFNACRVEFVSQYGKAKYDELDAACDAFMASGHPEREQFAKILKESSDPISAAAVMLNNVGFWSPEQPQYRAPAPVMPSNFVAARSVAARRGPAFSGPTPLNDIFARAR